MGIDFNPPYRGLTVIKSFPLLCNVCKLRSIPVALDYYKKTRIDLNLHILQGKGNDFITLNPRYGGLK